MLQPPALGPQFAAGTSPSNRWRRSGGEGQDEFDRIRAVGLADGARHCKLRGHRRSSARSLPKQVASRGRDLVGLLGISPTVEFESCQARCDEGKIICPGNQKTQIEQFEQRLPWVPCRRCDCPLATIDHGRPEAAVVSPASCFGSDVIGAKDQAQMCFRHINPQICVRRAPGYGFDNCDEMFAFGGTSGWRSRVTAFPRGNSRKL